MRRPTFHSRHSLQTIIEIEIFQQQRKKKRYAKSYVCSLEWFSMCTLTAFVNLVVVKCFTPQIWMQKNMHSGNTRRARTQRKNACVYHSHIWLRIYTLAFKLLGISDFIGLTSLLHQEMTFSHSRLRLLHQNWN